MANSQRSLASLLTTMLGSIIAVATTLALNGVAVAQSVGDSVGQSTGNSDTVTELQRRYHRHIEAGDYETALTLIADAYEQLSQDPEPDPHQQAAVSYDYGFTLLYTREFRQSRNLLREALSMHESVYGTDAIELVPVLQALAKVVPPGRIATRRGDNPQRTTLERALAIVGQHHGRSSSEHAAAALQAGQTALLTAGYAASQPYFDIARSYYSRVQPGSLETALTAYFLGRIARHERKSERAIELLTEALEGLSPDSLELRAYRDSALRELQIAYLIADRLEEFLTQYSNQFADSPNDEPLIRIAPYYPEDALLRDERGHVVMRMTIGTDGRPRALQVLESTADIFTDPAVRAMRNFLYLPAIVDGKVQPRPDVEARIIFDPDL